MDIKESLIKANEERLICEAARVGSIGDLRIWLDRGISKDSKFRNWTTLSWAACWNRLNIIQELVREGVDIDAKNSDEHKTTALMVAVSNGRKEAVELLIEKGIDINAFDQDGRNVLMLACSNGQKEVVGLLIEKGIDINAFDWYGMNALMFACGNGQKEVVGLLIEKGIDINAKSKNGMNALMLAKTKEMAELLIEKGIDVNAFDRYGRNALMLTKIREVAELLIEKGIDVNAVDQYGMNALMLAKTREVARLLIEKGVDVNEKSRNGRNALMLTKTREVAELLIEKGIDINAKDKEDGRNSLMWACDSGHKKIAELLIDKGIDINGKDRENGGNALMLACDNGHKKAAELLIDKGININAKDNYGGSALMFACGNGQKEVVALLIEKDVDINATDNDGMNALMFVDRYGSNRYGSNRYRSRGLAKFGNEELAMLLIDRGCQINDDTYDKVLECRNDHEGTKVRLGYLDTGVDINKYYPKLSVAFLVKNAGILAESNSKGYGAYHFGVLNPEVRVLEELLMQDELIDSINEYDNKGFTALKLATAMQEREEHIKLLISHGAFPIWASLSYSGEIGKVHNLLEDALLHMNEYISKEMTIDLLRKDKLAIASKVIFGYRDERESEIEDRIIDLLKKNKLELAMKIIYENREILESEVSKNVIKLLKESMLRESIEVMVEYRKRRKAKVGRGLKIVRGTWNQEYKDKIELRARDKEGKNILHYLALCGEREDMEEFVNKMMYIKIIEKLEKETEMGRERRMTKEEREEIREWLLEYDNEGFMPIHYAINEDNDEYIRVMNEKLGELDIEIGEEEIVTKEGKELIEYLKEKEIRPKTRREIKEWIHSADKRKLRNKIKILEEKIGNIIVAKEEDKKMYIEREEMLGNKKNLENKLKKEEATVEEKSKIERIIEIDSKNEIKDQEKADKLIEAINDGMRNFASVLWERIKDQSVRASVRDKLNIQSICRTGNAKVLKLVIDIKGEGECLKERDRRENTLLHIVSARGHEQVVEILLEYQEILKLIFEKNKNGGTVIHSTVKGGNIRVLELISHKLIELGRKDLVEEVDKKGKKALDLAVGMKKHNNSQRAIREGMIYGLLCLGEGIEYDPENYKKAIHMACDLGRSDLVLELAMGNMNEVAKGKTIIQRTVEEGMINVLEEITRMIMVEENYRELIQKKDEKGRPILELMKIRKGVEIARMLFRKAMRCGIRSEELVNEKNLEGEVPLLSLVRRAEEEKIEWEEIKSVLKYLIDNGADRKEESKEEVNTIEEVEDSYGEEEAKEIEKYEPDYSEKIEREKRYEEAKRISEEEKRKREEDINKVIAVMKGELDFKEEILSDGRRVIHFLIERDDRLAVKELLDRGAKGSDTVLMLDEEGRMIGERESAYKTAFRLKRNKIMEMMLERDESNLSLCRQFKEVIKDGKIDKDKLVEFERSTKIKGLLQEEMIGAAKEDKREEILELKAEMRAMADRQDELEERVDKRITKSKKEYKMERERSELTNQVLSSQVFNISSHMLNLQSEQKKQSTKLNEMEVKVMDKRAVEFIEGEIERKVKEIKDSKTDR